MTMQVTRTPSVIALAVSAVLSSYAQPVLAQQANEDDETEIIQVTGIRGSLASAAGLKRENSGVVDVITAEDIGKFPDANLAESLQRITGVSIDRRSNEGNQISVRGMGPSFNMVTLNGRQMPVASSPEQENNSSATQSRAFNFAEIASESVAAVNVYKTVRADLPTGGIGATVDLQTARPFALGETKGTFSLAGTHDASVDEGDSVTPEFGGLFSTYLSERVAVLFTGSYSKRDFTEREEHHDGWLRVTRDANANVFDLFSAAGVNVDGVNQLYRPITNISEIAENERERINAQAVLQVALEDNVTATIDYTLSRFNVDERRYQTGVFGDPINHGIQSLTFDANGTFTQYAFTGAADFLSYENELEINNDSLGINLDWQVTDHLNLNFDYHDSSSESQPDGQINDLLFLMQGALGVGFDFTYGGQPFQVSVDDSGANTLLNNGVPGGLTNLDGSSEAQTIPLNGFLDIQGLAPLGTFKRNIRILNEVEQFQVKGTMEFDDGMVTSVNFGGSYIDYEVDTGAVSSNFVFQGLGINPFTFGAVCDSPLCAQSSPLRQQISVGGGSGIGGFDTILRTPSPAEIAAGFPIDPDDIQPALERNIITELSTSFYINVNLETEIGDMLTQISVGGRYESTDINGTSVQSVPITLRTTSPTEQEVVNSSGNLEITTEGDYSHFLPALDFRIHPNDDMVVRASYGRSLARPDLNSVRGALAIADVRPSGPHNAVRGNPDLEPYLADNFDLAFEWYYKEDSYAAINFFYKQIENYIGTRTVQGPIENADGNPLTNPTGRFEGMPVDGEPGDPVVQFNILQPFNSGDADVDGWELAVQHVFGETGFGLQANYTIVDSDAEFDPNAVTQTVNLIGLSDSANLVAFYETDKFQVRAALNWRDEFLFSENQLRVQNEPVFFDSYTQLDVSASYEIAENWTLFIEGLNLTGEDQTQFGRYRNQFLYENDQEARYTFGVRASF